MLKNSETGADSGYEYVPPVEIDKDYPHRWLDIRTWRIWVKCANGRTLWRTVTIDRDHEDGLPDDPTPEQVTKYNVEAQKLNMEIEARLASEIAGLRLESTRFAIPPPADRRHVGGQDHSAADYRGGVKCWCGKDHGAHDYLGTTCWCGHTLKRFSWGDP
ncbi:MAG: hypothetical protein AABN33_05415 [Acidobacteriota bacterium]